MEVSSVRDSSVITQLQLPTVSKAITPEAGAVLKESHFIQVLATWKMGHSHLEAHLSILGILASLYRGTV